MKKNDLIAAVANKANVSKAEAEKIIDATLDVVTNTLKAGDQVRLVGFGTFVVSSRKAGSGRTPRASKGTPPPGMIETKSGRYIAEPVPGTIPASKIRAAFQKLART